MEKLKLFLFHKDLSSLFSLIAALLSLVGLIVYVNTGVSEFVSELSVLTIVSVSIAFVLLVIFTVFESKVGRFVCYALLLFAFIEFIGNQINLIANVVTSIDGNTWPVTFLVSAIALVLSFVLSLVSGIMTKDEIILLKGDSKNEISTEK